MKKKDTVTNTNAPMATTSLMRNNEPSKLVRTAHIATSGMLVAGLLITPMASVDARGMSAQAPGHQNQNYATPNINANDRAFENNDRSNAQPNAQEKNRSAQAESQKPSTPGNSQASQANEFPKVASENQRAQRSNSEKSHVSHTRPAPRVTICHRTNSATNPYVAITVSAMAVKSHGDESGHAQHAGPVANSNEHAQELKDKKIKWGDIIPPVEGITSGQNWTSENQAIHANGCQAVPASNTDDDDGDVIGDTDEIENGKGGVDIDAPGDQDTQPTEEGETLSASAQADYPGKLPKTGASTMLALLLSILSGAITGTYSWAKQRKTA